jgi:hypothetical protein
MTVGKKIRMKGHDKIHRFYLSFLLLKDFVSRSFVWNTFSIICFIYTSFIPFFFSFGMLYQLVLRPPRVSFF